MLKATLWKSFKTKNKKKKKNHLKLLRGRKCCGDVRGELCRYGNWCYRLAIFPRDNLYLERGRKRKKNGGCKEVGIITAGILGSRESDPTSSLMTSDCSSSSSSSSRSRSFCRR